MLSLCPSGLGEFRIKKVRKQIKRTLLNANNVTLHDPDLRKAVMDRFMELSVVKFK